MPAVARDARCRAPERCALMGYALRELELTVPLSPLAIEAGFDGIAVVVRRAGVPVGFFMQPLATPVVLSPETLARRIERHVGADLLRPALRDQLPLAGAAAARARPLAVTVAICTRERPDWVARCLRSLASVIAAGPAATQVELLVVDNASRDTATRRVAEAQPDVRYVYEPVPGLDFARNRALSEAKHALVAFLDDDVVVDAGWLWGLRSVFDDHPDAAGFAGLVLPLELETEAQVLFEMRGGFRRGFRRVCYRERGSSDPRFPLNPGRVGTGANMAIRRDVALSLGGFDEALDTGPPLPGGGDLDMFYRLLRAGHDIVYEPAYLVFHQHRRELPALRRQLHSWGTGPMAMLSKIHALEPAQRAKIRSQLGWWLGNQTRRLGASLIVKHRLPPDLVLAEFVGGVQGLLGEYARSQQRVAQRKRGRP